MNISMSVSHSMKTGEMVSSRWMVSGPRPSSGMGMVTCWLGVCAPACERPLDGCLKVDYTFQGS